MQLSMCHPLGVPSCTTIFHTGVYTPAWRMSPRWSLGRRSSLEKAIINS